MINPFAVADAQTLQKLLIALMPPDTSMDEGQKAEHKNKHDEIVWINQEEKRGALPANEYRILDQSSWVGWYYELEIGSETVVLREPGVPCSESSAQRSA